MKNSVCVAKKLCFHVDLVVGLLVGHIDHFFSFES